LAQVALRAARVTHRIGNVVGGSRSAPRPAPHDGPRGVVAQPSTAARIRRPPSHRRPRYLIQMDNPLVRKQRPATGFSTVRWWPLCPRSGHAAGVETAARSGRSRSRRRGRPGECLCGEALVRVDHVGRIGKQDFSLYAIWALAGVGRVPLATVLGAVGVAMMLVAGLPLLSLVPRSRLRARSLLRHRSDGLGNLEMELASDGEP
jgi:hypothetical protein